MRDWSHLGGGCDGRFGGEQGLDNRAASLTPFDMAAEIQFVARIQLAVCERA